MREPDQMTPDYVEGCEDGIILAIEKLEHSINKAIGQILGLTEGSDELKRALAEPTLEVLRGLSRNLNGTLAALDENKFTAE